MRDKDYSAALLFDFYGELLTERQRVCFDSYYNDDLSLSEIAEHEGITRQGVRELVQRAETTLYAMEEKAGLAGRFRRARQLIAEMESGLENLKSITDDQARELADSLIGILREISAEL